MCDATDAELKLRFAASASVLIDDIASAAPAVNTTQWAVQQLACAARYHGVTLVVNVCDIQPCATPASASTSSSVSAPSSSASAIPPPPSPPCQADGVYLFNTLLVLDATGAAVTKYYKSHLFTEARMFDAVPRAQRDLDTAWFDFAPNTVARSVSEPSTGAKRSADDGADGVAARARSTAARIGLFTCFDIEFAYPALPLMRTRGVTHLVLSSWWVNTLPLFHAAAIQQAFSRIAGDLAMHSADYGRDINVLSALSPALTSHRQSTFGRIGGQDGIESPSSTALADITLIAANSGRAQAAGGGVWSGGRPLVWLFDPSNDNVSQVLVAAVPVASAPAAAPLPAFQYRQGEVTRELDAKADTSFDCQFWLWHGRCVTLLDLPPSHASAADDDTSQSSAHATEPVDTTGTVTHGNFTCNIDAQLASISNFGAGAATTGANGPHSTSDRTRASSYLYVAFAFAGDLVFPKTPDSLRLRICAALVCAQTQTSRAGSMMPVQCASVTAAPAVVHAFRASAVFAPSVVVLPMLLTGPDAQVLPDPAASTALFSNATAAGTRASTGSGLTAGDASDSTDPIWRSFESRSEAGAFQPVPLLSLSMYGIDQAVD